MCGCNCQSNVETINPLEYGYTTSVTETTYQTIVPELKNYVDQSINFVKTNWLQVLALGVGAFALGYAVKRGRKR